MIYFIIFAIFLFCFEIAYFKIADHYNIIDKPNHRSSHTEVTIRGGGVIFAIAVLLFFFCYGLAFPFFTLGLVIISTISFLDDVLTLSNKIRLSMHLLSVALVFYQWDLFDFPFYWLIIAGIFVIGTINAYNFMDGINGITGSYSLLAILTLFYINEYIPFTSRQLLVIVGLALVIFNFFNFRKKAKCFAGDVGSVSIAFILVFLIGQLIIHTSNFSYILLLMVYGLDACVTIVFRILRKENIFEAHRSHFYQYLANQLKWPHLSISILYFVTQLVINVVLIFVIKDTMHLAVLLLITITILFIALRFIVEGKTRLLKGI